MASTEEDVKPCLQRTSVEELADKPLLPVDDDFPFPSFVQAHSLKNGNKLPQAISHRGYKAKYPENTLLSMRKAVEAGTHALETDIHLSKDGVVVLSHDPTLKRCYGKPDKIIDCEWEYLSTLRTTGENPQPMPRLLDLLDYLASPGLEELWVLLDIKLDNDADSVMRLIASTISSVPPSTKISWDKRVVLGIWATKYLPLCQKYLPGFSISYIGFSTLYASQFLTVPNISFNMLYAVLMGPLGSSFVKKCKKYGRPVFAWTVNEERKMRWCIRKGLDGVVTDDPVKYLEVCEEFKHPEKKIGDDKLTWKEWAFVLRIHLLVTVFFWVFMWRFGVRWGVEKRFQRRGGVSGKKA